MQEILSEIQKEEENKAHQEFYGNIAFNEWLEKHGLDPRPIGPSSATRERESSAESATGAQASGRNKERDGVKTAPVRESLQHPNSRQKNRVMVSAKVETMKDASKDADKDKFKGLESREPTMTSNNSIGLHESVHGEELSTQNNATLEGDGIWKGFFNSNPWNKSTKLPKKEYTPILGDHYPRDEYSMIPRCSPKRRSRNQNGADEDESSMHKPGAENLQNVPKDVIMKLLDQSKQEKPIVYKCKHIGDVHKKRHCDPDKLPRSECGMHMKGWDHYSHLFRLSLQPNLLSPSSASLSGLLTRDEENDIDDTDASSFAQWLKKMSKPKRYISIPGKQRHLSMGQLSAV